jgi:XTP/dITP diphosphohydrolase
VTVAAIAVTTGEIRLARGVLEGSIAEEAAGSFGFGYDPVFVVPEHRQTLAELSPVEKNRISHRARAFTQAKHMLQQMTAQKPVEM